MKKGNEIFLLFWNKENIPFVWNFIAKHIYLMIFWESTKSFPLEKNPMNSSAAPTSSERYQSLHASYDAQKEQYKCLLVEHEKTSTELKDLTLELLTTLTFDRRNRRLINDLKSNQEALGKISDVFEIFWNY